MLDAFPEVLRHPAQKGEQLRERPELLALAGREVLDPDRHSPLLGEPARAQVHDESPFHGQVPSRLVSGHRSAPPVNASDGESRQLEERGHEVQVRFR